MPRNIQELNLPWYSRFIARLVRNSLVHFSWASVDRTGYAAVLSYKACRAFRGRPRCLLGIVLANTLHRTVSGRVARERLLYFYPNFGAIPLKVLPQACPLTLLPPAARVQASTSALNTPGVVLRH
jgi:hypothetical protein